MPTSLLKQFSKVSSGFYLRGTLRPTLKVLSALYLTFTCVLFFHVPIADFVLNRIVNVFGVHVISSWPNDILVLGVFFGLMTIELREWKKSIPDSKYTIGLIFLAVFYFAHSNINPWFQGDRLWENNGFSLCNPFSYGYLFLIYVFIRCFRHVGIKSNQLKSKNIFYNDVPKISKNSQEDLLGYSEHSKDIAGLISECNFDSSYTIGVNSKWGDGKTTFLNYIREELVGEDVIQINFNPWLSNAKSVITEEFFAALEEALGPYYNSKSKLIKEYSQRIVSLESPSNIFQSMLSLIQKPVSIRSLQEEISDILFQIDKKIIVYIDDIDRLNSEEIFEIVRIVRSTGNFKKLYFVIAYDKEYLLNAIKEVNRANHSKYLDKIIQFEVSLPYVPKSVYVKEFYNLVKEGIRNEELYKRSGLNRLANNTSHIIGFVLSDWISNLRDATRLANSVLAKMRKLKGEILIDEVIVIEVLRLNSNKLYNKLKQNPSDLLYRDTKSGQYRVRTNEQPNKRIVQRERILPDSLVDISTSKEFSLITALFEPNSSNFYEVSTFQTLSITNPRRFHLYFSYGLTGNVISNMDYKSAFHSGLAVFIEFIDKSVKNGYKEELIENLYELSSFENKDEFERFVRAILFLVEIDKSDDTISFGYADYDFKNLNSQLKLGRKHYEIEDDYFEFLKEMLKVNKFPYEFSIGVIRNSIDSFNNSTLLPHTDLLMISNDMFKSYSVNSKKLDRVFWSLYWTMHRVSSSLDKQGDRSVNVDAAETMLTEIAQRIDLKRYLESMIETEPFDGKKYCIHYKVRDRFGGWDKYTQWLSSHKGEYPNEINEIESLLKLFSKTEYKNLVPFKFSFLDPHRSLD